MNTSLTSAQSAQQSNRTLDGKYTFGTHTEPEALDLFPRPSSPPRTIYRASGAKALAVDLSGHPLPQYPDSLPPATVSHELNSVTAEWETCIQVGDSDHQTWVYYDHQNGMVYASDAEGGGPYGESDEAESLDEVTKDDFNEWSVAVHERALVVLHAHTEKSVPEDSMADIVHFTTGQPSITRPYEDGRWGERNAAMMQEALSNYLKPPSEDIDDDDRLTEAADLFTNLRHWCDKNQMDFDAVVDKSYGAYKHEKDEDEAEAKD